MTTSIERTKVGATKRVSVTLDPGTYELVPKVRKPGEADEFVVLKVRCRVEATFTFQGWQGWTRTTMHYETLEVLPTKWQRFKAFILCRPSPLPRAVALTDVRAK
jgi:hypothetical protein